MTANIITKMYMLQDDNAMILFGDDDEIYQEDSLPSFAPTQSMPCLNVNLLCLFLPLKKGPLSLWLQLLLLAYCWQSYPCTQLERCTFLLV